MQILGPPAGVLEKTASPTKIGFSGTDWDPTREVRVEAIDVDGNGFARMVVTADAAGKVSGVVRNRDAAAAAALRMEQTRPAGVLSVTVTRTEVASGADGKEPKAPGSNGNPGAGTVGVAPPPARVTTPPLQIPAPIDLPVVEVPAPGDPAQPPTAEPTVAVTKAELHGSATLGDLFGAAPERMLHLTVENVGDVAVTAPGLSIAVGKGDPEPVFLSDGIGRLGPGEVTEIKVPISLPVGANGTYRITGRVGDGETGEFALTWETYPWGLFGLNGLGVLLVAWAVRRRFFRADAPLIAAGAPLRNSGDMVGEGEAVIDLATLERWWALQAAGGSAIGEGMPEEFADAVVDVDAVERWLERRRAHEITKP